MLGENYLICGQVPSRVQEYYGGHITIGYDLNIHGPLFTVLWFSCQYYGTIENQIKIPTKSLITGDWSYQ